MASDPEQLPDAPPSAQAQVQAEVRAPSQNPGPALSTNRAGFYQSPYQSPYAIAPGSSTWAAEEQIRSAGLLSRPQNPKAQAPSQNPGPTLSANPATNPPSPHVAASSASTLVSPNVEHSRMVGLSIEHVQARASPKNKRKKRGDPPQGYTSYGYNGVASDSSRGFPWGQQLGGGQAPIAGHFSQNAEVTQWGPQSDNRNTPGQSSSVGNERFSPPVSQAQSAGAPVDNFQWPPQQNAQFQSSSMDNASSGFLPSGSQSQSAEVPDHAQRQPQHSNGFNGFPSAQSAEILSNIAQGHARSQTQNQQQGMIHSAAPLSNPQSILSTPAPRSLPKPAIVPPSRAKPKKGPNKDYLKYIVPNKSTEYNSPYSSGPPQQPSLAASPNVRAGSNSQYSVYPELDDRGQQSSRHRAPTTPSRVASSKGLGELFPAMGTFSPNLNMSGTPGSEDRRRGDMIQGFWRDQDHTLDEGSIDRESVDQTGTVDADKPSGDEDEDGSGESDFLDGSDMETEDDDEFSDTDSILHAHAQIKNDLRKEVFKVRELHKASASKKKSKKPAPVQRRKGGLKGPRKIAELTGDIKLRISRANQFFGEGKLSEARREAQEIIQINAEVYQAYSLLAAIFKEWNMNEDEMLALQSCCHFMQKDEAGNMFLHLARRFDQLDPESRQKHLRSGLECCSGALKSMKNNVEALCLKAGFNRDLNRIKTAIGEYEAALKKDPYNPRAMRGLAECHLDNSKPELAKKIYEDAITFYQDLELSDNRFGWNEVNIFVELYASTGEYAEAIQQMKSLSRWVLGRRDEEYWDRVTNDDREWDTDDLRRDEVPSYVRDKYDILTYGDGLPLELRVKLGLYRLKLGDFNEAMNHFGFLETEAQFSDDEELASLVELFHEVGDRLYEAEHYEEALTFYEILTTRLDKDPDFSHHLPMGKCYFQVDDLQRAEKSFLTTLQYDEGNIDARQELAKLYDGTDKEKAAEYRQEIMDLTKKSIEKYQRAGKAKEKPAKAFIVPKPVKADRRKHIGENPNVAIQRKLEEERIAGLLRCYETLQRCAAGLAAGEAGETSEWMAAAAELVADFRTCKGLYPYDKFYYSPSHTPRSQKEKENAIKNANRAAAPDEEVSQSNQPAEGSKEKKTVGYEKRRPEMPTDHLGISWATWLDILIQYALSLARQSRYLDSYDVCISAKEAVVFCHNQESMFTIYLCWCTCAVLANDMDTIVSQCRHFLKEYQFTTDAYRLFSTLVRLCQSPLSHLTKGPTTKFILRNIKTMDFSLSRDEALKESTDFTNMASYTARDAEGKLVVNTEMDVCLLLLYGHILYVNTSFGKALHYLFRAYSLDPANPSITLSIGLCYIQYAIKRQTAYRPYVILQGISFMQSYYDTQSLSKTLEEREEAHYNMARTYHMLGLAHLAVPFYVKVLREEEDARKEGGRGREDLCVEAAYCLQTAWCVAGNMGLARAVTEKWLVI